MTSPADRFFDEKRDALGASIDRAQARLMREFERDPAAADQGYWCGELEADTTLESDYIVFLAYLDRDGYSGKIRRFAANILRHQLADGSWNIFHGGPGEISATVKAYLALRLAGHAADEPFMCAAREAALRLGGAEKVNSFTKFYLALLGQIDWDEVPAIPPEIILLPRFSPINIYEISYWSRAILVPLSILYSTRAVARPREGSLIEELFHNRAAIRWNFGTKESQSQVQADAVDAAIAAGLANVYAEHGSNGGAQNGGAEQSGALGNGARAIGAGPANRNGQRSAGDLIGAGNRISGAGNGAGGAGNGTNGKGAHRPDHAGVPTNGNGSSVVTKGNGFFSWENFFVMTDRLLKLVERTPLKPLRKLALKKAEEWMVERFADSDGLGAIFPSMVNSVMALISLGYERDHPHVIEGIAQLERLEIDDGDVARLQPCLSPIWDTAKAVNALHESGVPSDNEILLAAGRWFVAREVRRPGDWKIRVPHVEIGGWPFQFRNGFYPDIDDTAAVVMALGRLDASRVDGIKDSIMRGIHWVTDMQCSCGGWAAFDVDVQRGFLTKVPYADHNAMLDPPCADITGRCLEMYGRFPELMQRPEIREVIRKGVDYLKRAQEPDGSWYGRWGVNYIYGTWQALKGLVAVGEDRRQRYIRRAVGFLLSAQNDDGGWGECCSSYDQSRSLSHRARGESTASQTAWALMGLIAAGLADSPEVQRGVEYLLDRQAEDGNWAEDAWTGTGFPSVFYLKYHLYRLYFPLWALGMYRNAKTGVSTLGSRDDQLQEILSANRIAPRRGLRALFGV